MVGKAQRKECEAVGHITLKVRKQRVLGSGTQLTFSFN